MANKAKMDVRVIGDDLPLPDEDELGPKMRALKLQYRVFVWRFMNNGCNAAEAAAHAGYGRGDHQAEANYGSRLRYRPEILEAMHECAGRQLHGLSVPAIAALQEILMDQHSKLRMKAVEAVLARTGFPEHRSVTMHHTTEDSRQIRKDIEALARKLGMDPEVLLGETAPEPPALTHQPAVEVEFVETHSTAGLEDLL